jgi:tartrate dehydrogenase/decarboxylase/D-malate dehydrogenase
MSSGSPTQRLAVIPGDGVGAEVTEVGLRVLEALAELDARFAFEIERFPWGCAYHAEHGEMAPPEALATLDRFDAIYFGAVGWPTVPDHVSLWGLRLLIVQGLDQGVNVRPVKLLPGTASPLAGRGADEIDFVVVRENSEGEYSGAGGWAHRGLPTEVALQTSVYSRPAIERVARYAFRLAEQRPAGRLTSVTKSNASQYASVLWDEVVGEVAAEHPEVEFDSVLVDAAAARFVLDPGSLDVVLASNLHADILSDLAGALAGSLGVAPSGNYHLDGRHPSMFEPVHGSAPDIAGKGVANPIAAVLCVAMMLEHLGWEELGDVARAAVDDVCRTGILTPDIGGSATTSQVGEAIVSTLAARLPAAGGAKGELRT